MMWIIDHTNALLCRMTMLTLIPSTEVQISVLSEFQIIFELQCDSLRVWWGVKISIRASYPDTWVLCNCEIDMLLNRFPNIWRRVGEQMQKNGPLFSCVLSEQYNGIRNKEVEEWKLTHCTIYQCFTPSSRSIQIVFDRHQGSYCGKCFNCDQIF